MWRAKCIAAAKHCFVTLIVALIVSFLVFVVWYPGIYSELMPGTKLFALVAIVEVVLGPCMTLIVFNPSKSRRELMVDYFFIVSIQLSAFAYGVFNVIESRPAYIVFVKDRFEVVSASEINPLDRAEAQEKKYKHASWRGPEFICVRPVSDPKERERLLFTEIPLGKDVQYLPRFYRACTSEMINGSAKSLESLKTILSAKHKTFIISEQLKKYPDVRWLPIMGKTGVWVAFVESSSAMPVDYLNIDPF